MGTQREDSAILCGQVMINSHDNIDRRSHRSHSSYLSREMPTICQFTAGKFFLSTFACFSSTKKYPCVIRVIHGLENEEICPAHDPTNLLFGKVWITC